MPSQKQRKCGRRLDPRRSSAHEPRPSGQRRRLGMGLCSTRAAVRRRLRGISLTRSWSPAGRLCLPQGRSARWGSRRTLPRFFEGLHVEVADYTPAFEGFGRGEDQLVGPVPFHGSFEDREGAPDPVFAALGPEQAEAQVSGWEGVFERAGFGSRRRHSSASPDGDARGRRSAVARARPRHASARHRAEDA